MGKKGAKSPEVISPVFMESRGRDDRGRAVPKSLRAMAADFARVGKARREGIFPGQGPIWIEYRITGKDGKEVREYVDFRDTANRGAIFQLMRGVEARGGTITGKAMTSGAEPEYDGGEDDLF